MAFKLVTYRKKIIENRKTKIYIMERRVLRGNKRLMERENAREREKYREKNVEK